LPSLRRRHLRERWVRAKGKISAATGDGSSRSIETTVPLPNTSFHGVHSLDAEEDSESILEMKSLFYSLFVQ
jgi:hypothetical protein